MIIETIFIILALVILGCGLMHLGTKDDLDYFILFIYLLLFCFIIISISLYQYKHNKKEETVIQQTINTDLIKEKEGLRLEEYPSIEDKDKQVVCYGNSKYSFKEHFGDKEPIKELCDSLVEKISIDIYLQLEGEGFKLNKNQEEALICLIYNLKGGYRAFADTNLYQYIYFNTDDALAIQSIIKEWMDICRVNNKIEKGLLNRRQRELKHFFKDYEDEAIIYHLIDKEYASLVKKCKK